MSACTLGRVYAQICLLGCQRICCLRDFSPPWKGRIGIAVQEEEEEATKEVDGLSPYLPTSLPASIPGEDFFCDALFVFLVL